MEVKKEFIFGEDREFESAHGSTLVRLDNGEVLAAWFGGSWEKGADTAIYIARRTEGGWSRPEIAANSRRTAMWNPVLFKRHDGTVMLFYKVGAAISEWQTWVIVSDDGGHTWTEPRELVPGDACGGRGPVKNKPIHLANGDIIAPASLEGGVWDAFADISHDEGRTWERSSLVPVRRAGYEIQTVDKPYSKYRCFGKGIIQPTLWEDESGVHMLLRSTSSAIFRSDSHDGGRTWSQAYALGLPNNNSGIDLVQMPSGTLALAYNPTQNLPNYYKGPRTPLVVSMSHDGGGKWETAAVLEDGEGCFAYPSIINGAENELLVTYTWKRERIVFAQIKL